MTGIEIGMIVTGGEAEIGTGVGVVVGTELVGHPRDMAEEASVKVLSGKFGLLVK